MEFEKEEKNENQRKRKNNWLKKSLSICCQCVTNWQHLIELFVIHNHLNELTWQCHIIWLWNRPSASNFTWTHSWGLISLSPCATVTFDDDEHSLNDSILPVQLIDELVIFVHGEHHLNNFFATWWCLIILKCLQNDEHP